MITEKSVVVYETEDGRTFTTFREARNHEIKLSMMNIIRNDLHYSDEILENITTDMFRNATEIISLLSSYVDNNTHVGVRSKMAKLDGVR